MLKSVKTKLLIVILALVSVPLILTIVISYRASTKKAMEDAQSNLEWQAWYLEAEFSKVIEKNLSSLSALAADNRVIAFLEGDPSVTEEELLFTCNGIDDYFQDGNCTVITDTTGMQRVRTVGSCVDITERDYFKAAISGEVYVSNVIISKSTGVRQVTFAMPVKNQAGAIIGIVQRNYDLNDFHELLADESDDAFICAWDGIIAAHAQHEIVGGDEEEDRSNAGFFTSGLEEGYYTADTGKGYAAMMAYVKEPRSGYIVVAASNTKITMAAARTAAMQTVLVGLILLVVAAAVTIFVTKSMTAPIADVNQSLANLAEGKFTAIHKFENRVDEYGEMIRSTNAVIDKLTQTVTNIKKSADAVGTSSGELSDMANQISQTAEDVSNAVQEIASGATQQADEIQRATENVGNIGEAISDVQLEADELKELASSMKEASAVSSKSLEELKVSSDDMSSKIAEIEKTIYATKNAVASMSEKVDGISSVAAQTNLLSLNASIEAARAGEAGRGFAVVAEEIGKLADSSKLMADEIKSEMDVLLVQSEAAVSAAVEVKDGNTNQITALDKTLDSIGGMLSDIESTVKGIDRITSGTEQCVNAKNVVGDSMSSLSAVSEENAASSEETGASMEELSATVTTLAGSAGDLKTVSENLTEEMKFFQI